MKRPGLQNHLPLLCALLLSVPLWAQQMASTGNPGVDEKQLTTLHGSVHPLARAEYDRGAVADEFPMRRLLLTIARPADREENLQQFLRSAHTRGSSVYRQWVTPEEFGLRFGAADEDTQLISGWLASHGMTVARVTRSKSIIEFSGTAGQIREALHTEIHQYNVQGKTFYANAGEISVPSAIASRIRGFAPLNSFPLDSYLRPLGGGTLNRVNHKVAPQFTLTENNQPFYAFAPEDFATQYDVTPAYAAGINGTAQTIGIIGEYNINLAMVDAYRKLFNLPADHTQVIIDGQDPGDEADSNIEGALDVEVSGAVAPNATVNLYAAGGGVFQDSLALAALRAIDDNQASVLSVSYGNCEQLLGEDGNQLWANLWEQAAAQGQTVFVSSGDSGPATCQGFVTFSNGNTQAIGVPNVNGLSSTPWNVSVGGTDFYYSDYASGAPSAATLWNQSNDSSNGSLKASLPEQPWDNALGLDVNSNVLGGGAGGGGASNCSQENVPTDDNVLPTCLAGYPKPAWQSAPGVPNDGVRDLPDVSLFASSGANLSAVPICALPGDCAPVTSGDPQIFLVGGTSASSPAMAGIMALINQKYGRQGQANYTLYALARQFPTVFHDITLGTNDIACELSESPECTTPIPGFTGVDSYGIYAAAPGYDQASGLGSVDVNLLLNDWNKISYSPSTTSLQASPATIVHGSPVTVSVAVTAASGSTTPSGSVVLQAGSGVTIPDNLPLNLINGSVSSHLTNLPGGSYELTAEYAGDGSFASSTSTPVTLTVSPEASATTITGRYAYTSYSNPDTTIDIGKISEGGQAPFGSTWSFTATPSGQEQNAPALGTGTAVFTDGGTAVTIPLNANGTATWTPQSLAIGTHSVTATYSGDASYQGSTSSALTFTIVKGTSGFDAVPENNPSSVSISGSTLSNTYASGTDLIVHVLLRAYYANVAPTGMVTVSLGPLSQTIAVTTNSYPNQNLSTAFVTIPNVPAGTYTLSASYSGDSNWNADTFTYPSPMTFAAANQSATATSLTLTPSSVDTSGSVTFNVTIQAPSSHLVDEFGQALLYANGTLFGSIPVESSAGQNLTGKIAIAASTLPYGNLQVVAAFTGSQDLGPSVSSPVPLTVTVTDFSLSVVGRNLSIPSGQSLSVPVALGGPYSANVAVALSCATSSASLGCTINPNSASVTGSGSASLTINAFTSASAASTAAGSADSRKGRVPLHSGEALALALLMLVALPRHRRWAKLWVLLVLSLGLTVAIGCGGGSSSSSSKSTPPPKNTVTPAPPGSYSVTITGTSTGIIHSATLNIQVQ